jgi:hypothetical protein
MIRANLLPRPSESLALFGFQLDADYLRQALLGVSIVAAIALLGVGIEMLRLHRLGVAANDADAALLARAPVRVESKRLALEVARYQQIAREAGAVRRSGPAAAVAIARIGNAVPARVWLDSLTRTSNGFELSGGSRSVDALSGAMVMLNRALPQRTASLVSIDNRNSASDGIRFTARILDATTPGSSR